MDNRETAKERERERKAMTRMTAATVTTAAPLRWNGKTEKVFIRFECVDGVFDTIISFVFSCENQFRFAVPTVARSDIMPVFTSSNVQFDFPLLSFHRLLFILTSSPSPSSHFHFSYPLVERYSIEFQLCIRGIPLRRRQNGSRWWEIKSEMKRKKMLWTECECERK